MTVGAAETEHAVATFSNPGPRYKTSLVLPPGLRRVVEDGEPARLHSAPANLPGSHQALPAGEFGDAGRTLVVKVGCIGGWAVTKPFLANLGRNSPQFEITSVVLRRVFD